MNIIQDGSALMNNYQSRRQFTKTLLGTVACCSLTPMASTSNKKPNIVYIMADDLGYGDVGCYGCRDIQTPNIDRLAGQGVRFTQYYANSAECTPTRTALMTGRYQQRVGGLECAIGNGHVGRYDDAIRLRARNELGLPTSQTTIAKLMKQAGYRTGICGKWHLGYDPKFSPLNHGFDYFFGPLSGGIDYFHHTEPNGMHTLYRNREEVFEEGYITDLITKEARGFIHREKENPFFLYVPFSAPHSPYQGPGDKENKRKTDENWNQGSRETFAQMVERMDWGIGQILAELDKHHLTKNTLVIFVSDNGGAKYANNGPFNRGKGTLYEGGIRVPGIVRWPGTIEPGTVANHVCLTMDLTASLARVIGQTPPQEKPFDGIDILKQIQAGQKPNPRLVFWRKRRGDRTWRAAREGDLKYLSRQDGDTLQEYLFDLAADPAEENNLLKKRKLDVKRLKNKLHAWEREVQPRR
ncbi:sulfatase-like hydrolase/transferase [bacterium]|nr:sulfatase-like hydrolase/transferase [bacterium]